ncbi:MAG: DedA family protein [Candidatus Gracilibacteria bacterium]|jgi:membrane protein DedA with SNARE-associated domain
METPFDSIIALITTYKYYILFPISIFEGPVVTIIGGLLSAHGLLNIFIAFAVLMAGDMAGDTLYYSIGRWGSRHFIRKWGHYIGLKEDKLIHIENHFKKHAIKTLLLGKTQAIGGIFLAAAGMSKMSYWKFMWINILGSIPKIIILLAIGFYLGTAMKLIIINNYISYYAIIATIILIMIIVLYFVFKPKIKD